MRIPLQDNFLAQVTTKPGVYQMLDHLDKVLYVGKAKNLKKRLASYLRNDVPAKTATFMAQVVAVEIIITPNETSALLLEYNLIKKLRPRYNILFKDDKSFRYIVLTKHAFPQLVMQHKKTGEYFGPYPNAKAVYDTLELLQKVFRLRNCTDTFFKARTRPCLQYQMQRCSGPCVGKITKAAYQQAVTLVRNFLQGSHSLVFDSLTQKMQQAALQLDFENAIFYRNQISNLRSIGQQQSNLGDLDAIAVLEKHQTCCINIIVVRYGQVLGSHTLFPDTSKRLPATDWLSTFLGQYYLQQADDILPRTMVINQPLPERQWLATLLSEVSKRKIVIIDKITPKYQAILAMAETNALHALSNKWQFYQQWQTLQKILAFTEPIETIVGFDVSHLSGTATVVAAVMFDRQGPVKAAYRKYNIPQAQGDDYAALREALKRYIAKVTQLPSIILIDGGKGQLHIAAQVLAHKFTGKLLAIAKGPARKPGLEKIYEGRTELAIDPVTLLLLQQVRDEAHRFAVASHHKLLAKSRTSILEKIPGIGKTKRQQLLQHFGGLQGLQEATIADLTKVTGINANLAQRIYQALHD